MKPSLRFSTLLAAAIALGATGCVQTIYTKTVQVRRDPSGNVLDITDVESVSQPGRQPKYIRFEHLKADSKDAETIKPQ